jgi:hypothetical protein
MGLKMPGWRHCMSLTRRRRDMPANTSVPVFRLQLESTRWNMPEKDVVERAREDARQGKSPSTQAGEFVHEEIEHVKVGKHGARSTKQAIAIGLSKARRAGIELPPPKEGTVSAKTRKQIRRDSAKGLGEATQRVSAKRSRASTAALQRETNGAASHEALSRHARSSARQRGSASLKNSARKAVRTKGEAGLKGAAQKAARTRTSRQH